MERALSFEQMPPLADPLRYFLTAPAFALAAGLALAWSGPAGFASRWSPLALGLTHLLTLGFLTPVMIGSLLQMLPVVTGTSVPAPRLTAAAVHLSLCLGAAALAGGFFLELPLLFMLAMPLLAFAIAAFLLAGWLALKGCGGGNPTVTAIRLALLALAGTTGLGLTLAAAFTTPLPLPLLVLTDLHAFWGLGGWVGLLVAGIAYQVVPMFQLTPPYSAALSRWLAPVLFMLAVAAGTGVQRLSAAATAVGYLLFAGATLFLLRRRKRPKADAPALFWYVSIASLAASALLWLAGEASPGWRMPPSYPFGLGVLMLVGFAFSVVNGMLYKIVPFLVWYHLQSLLAGAPVKAPNVRQVIPETAARRQFGLHLLALLLMLAASAWPQHLARPAGVAFAVSVGALWFNLLRAARLYRVLSQAIARAKR